MNQIDHKNIELLRYYISRDMRRIEDKISNDKSDLVGYFVASLVDALIVAMFSEWLQQLRVRYKVLIIAGFIVSFFLISRLTNWIRGRIVRSRRASGRDNEKPEEILRIVDEFDNIAVDGLLLCSYYKERYEAATDKKMKLFYLYETFHYLEKSCAVYRRIQGNYGSYVSTEDDLLISEYRVKNYLDIVDELSSFIKSKVEGLNDSGLEMRVNNVVEDISKWRKPATP